MFLQIFRTIRKPTYQIKSKIEQTDPVLYRETVQRSKELKPALPIKESQEGKLFVFTLQKFKESIHNQEIKAYATNTKLLFISSLVSLTSWFLGSLLIIAVIAYMK